MTNITLSIEDDLLKESRKYAQKHNMSLNALIRDFLRKMMNKNKSGWQKDFFAMADRCSANSKGKKWTREDLYRA